MSPRRAKHGHPQRMHRRYMSYRDLMVMYEGRSQQVPLRVPDLSTHGMFINTPQAFPEGSVLKLNFILSRTGHEVSTRAEVRYCLEGVGMGVEFIDISVEDQEAISEELELADLSAARAR